MCTERINGGVEAVAPGARPRVWFRSDGGSGLAAHRRLAKEGEGHASAVEQEGILSLDVDSSQAALRQAGRQQTAFGRGMAGRLRSHLSLFFFFLKHRKCYLEQSPSERRASRPMVSYALDHGNF